MNGSDFYTAVTTLLNNFQMNQVLFYQLLNVARIQREISRPFIRLQKMDASNIVSAVGIAPLIPQTGQALTLPTDFLFFRDDGKIILSNNNQIWQPYSEIPLSLAIPFLQINNNFYIDHVSQTYYLTGLIDQQYTAYMYYQADFGDITANTSWLNIPKRFQMMLAFDVAAMYRLGVNYDDINARNADSNHQQAELIFNVMANWDNNLQRSAVTNLDYPTPAELSGHQNHKIPIDG